MIGLAHAQEAAAAAPGGFSFEQLFPLIFIVVLFYFIAIRPQMKRAKEHKAMTEALHKGDEVVTQGGVAGRVTKLGDAYVALEIAQGTEVVIQRTAIQLVLPKGTIKSVL